MKTYNNAEMGLRVARIAVVIILVVCLGIMVCGWITGITLPDAAVRILGGAELIALPTAVFTSIRLRRNS